MHEMAVMSYLLEAVEAEAQRIGAQRVLAINLVMGERASVFDDSLLFYFDLLTPGTVAAGAQLHVRRTAMRFHCAGCDQDYSPVDDTFRCPQCRIVGQVTADGTELLIESIEVES
ncbi:MAG TPA: hydrogenase maturation nickel metallochaperone HypA [Chloroflexia bacterium]|nr:hydrogenase maturation nickel metallochaperone HypA [Chloroflexia bacterium]